MYKIDSDLENRDGGGRGKVREPGMDMCTLLCLK